MRKSKKTNINFYIKMIIITLLGLLMIVYAINTSPTLSRFFELSKSGRGGYFNHAILFFVGLLLAGYGLYEIGRAIYLQWKKSARGKNRSQ